MAIYHLSAKIISRGKGQSAIAAAAYRSGQRLTDEASGAIKHYEKLAGRVVYAAIYAPLDAPAWARDRNLLWNEAERMERRRDARLAREIELALPHELTDRQRVWLLQEFCRDMFVRRGMAVDVAIHAPDKSADPRNVHAHILIANRRLNRDGFAATKDRSLNSKATLRQWRAHWQKLVNAHLARHGHAARIDHRTLKEQGVRLEPGKHLGYAVTRLERRKVRTGRGDEQRAILSRNAVRRGARGAAQETGCHAPSDSMPGQPGRSLASGPGSAVERLGFRQATSALATAPTVSGTRLGAPAAAIQQTAPETTRAVYARAAQVMSETAALIGGDIGGPAPEPCSYEAEAAWIVAQHTSRIDGIRQSALSREDMQAAIRAVMEQQRYMLAAMRERRRWLVKSEL